MSTEGHPAEGQMGSLLGSLVWAGPKLAQGLLGCWGIFSGQREEAKWRWDQGGHLLFKFDTRGPHFGLVFLFFLKKEMITATTMLFNNNNNTFFQTKSRISLFPISRPSYFINRAQFGSAITQCNLHTAQWFWPGGIIAGRLSTVSWSSPQWGSWLLRVQIIYVKHMAQWWMY